MCVSSGTQFKQQDKLAPADGGTRNCRNVGCLLTGQKGVTLQMVLMFIFKFVAASIDQSAYRADAAWTVCSSISSKD
jgi:hypothetical protein